MASIADLVTSACPRLERLSKTVPSLKRSAWLARNAILLTRGDPATRSAVARSIAEY